MRSPSNLAVQLMALAALATGGYAQTAATGPAAGGASVARDTVPLLGTDLEAEKATAAAERWGAPFAVSSAGRVEPREPREVTIIGADPTIAEGLGRVREAGSAREPREPTRGSAPSRREVEDPDDGARVHRVREGETWFEIASRYGISPQTLERANPAVEPGEIRAGQLLEIPGDSSVRPSLVVHRVAIGETLWEIARRYAVSPESIREANDLDEDRLRPDQALVIPVAAAGARPGDG